ncbi:MAG: amidohydrolase [Candidatus Latescibacteria bacterium]|nr:amidohydrolase [Candidatus Latescibacterota bacterium]
MRVDFQTFLPGQFDGKPFGPEDLTALADEAGVERFVVMPETAERPDNAGLAARIKGEQRMVGCASVNPTRGEEAVREFEAAVKSFGFRGLRLSPFTHGYSIDGEVARPALEKAGELGVPVTMESCSEGCWPSQVARVAEQFPGVTIIADVGFRPLAPPVSLGLAAPREGRIADVALERPNVYLGLTALGAAETYLIKRLLGAVGTDKFIFGSNAPSGIPLFAIGGFQRAGLGEQAEAMIFGETLRRIYRLERGDRS